MNGLPVQYFVTEANPSTGWVQIVFQAIGLRSLLSASLQLGTTQQIMIHSEETTVIVVRCRQGYIALQFQDQLTFNSATEREQLMTLVNGLEAEKLHQHPHFKAI